MALDIAGISYIPEPIRSEIDASRRMICNEFHTKLSLKWEPHITIASRVLLPEGRKQEIFRRIENLCKNTRPIEIKTTELYMNEVKGLPFENPFVITLTVQPNNDLANFHNSLESDIYRGLERPIYRTSKYKPHITLAYRDLTRENFENARKFLAESTIKTNYEFLLDNLQLATEGKQGRWSSIKSFRLKGR